MRIPLLTIYIAFTYCISCTDSDSEELIEGHWHAATMFEDTTEKKHQLPDGFHLNFDYPKYSFEGKKKEEGNYYIRKNQLHLIPTNKNTERDLPVRKLTRDSLILQLKDSLGTRSVLFLRDGK